MIDPSNDISSFQTALLTKKKKKKKRLFLSEKDKTHTRRSENSPKVLWEIWAFTIACLSYTICSIVACTLRFRFLKFTDKKEIILILHRIR